MGWLFQELNDPADLGKAENNGNRNSTEDNKEPLPQLLKVIPEGHFHFIGQLILRVNGVTDLKGAVSKG